ncbi:O-antigen flippase Wzx [Algibacter lectus]|uniref:O-antigen flippase Wzx n=1 Tax=Algibacter lectus TaxID=221126 RepID=A0A090WN41_9FLAO|nr:hypothetical protein [Algibacter lectus]GAL77633.1 O-antigen flippase Wzx [Algibacter lectus]
MSLLGYRGTLNSFLGFLNLVELGIGSAIGFTLYKPLFNKDYKEIDNIVNLFGYLYKKIGLIVLIAAIILSLFFPFIFSNATVSLGLIYFLFYAYLYTSLQAYFYNYNLILIQSDQKGYIVTTYLTSANLIRVFLQIIVVYYFQSYIGYIIIDMLVSTSYSYFLRKKIDKHYPWLTYNTKNNNLLKAYPGIVTKIKQISVHRISGFILSGTDKLLIFAFVSIQSVAFFGNYQLILTNFAGLLNNFFSGIGAGVGNLVAENDKEKINNVFWQMMAFRFFIAGLSFFILFNTVEPFIQIWLGEKYILEHYILLLMLLNLFILQIRGTVDNFIQAYGLYNDTWAPIAESILNLGLSLILVQSMGIIGILLGTFVSMSLIVLVWKPYFLYKNGFKQGILVYWFSFIKHVICFIVAILICNYIKSTFSLLTESFIDLVLFGIKITLTITIVYAGLIYLASKGFRRISKRFYFMIFNKLNNR